MACDDANLATTNDLCNGTGTCAGTTIVCPTPTQCQTAGVPNGTTCDVGNKPNTATCDDGSATTNNDRCDGTGGCAGTTIVCPEPTQCQTAGVPNGTTCVPGNKPNTATCDDDNDATNNDLCNGSGACLGTTISVPSRHRLRHLRAQRRRLQRSAERRACATTVTTPPTTTCASTASAWARATSVCLRSAS